MESVNGNSLKQRKQQNASLGKKTADRETYGIHFVTIPPSERASLGYQLERLRKLGWNLPAAVNFIERHGKAPPSILLGLAATEFLAAKKAAGLRPRYLRTLKASINRFLINRREKIISEISAAEILEYISRNGWATSTMRSYLIDVRTLFAYAVKRKYLPENPALAVDLPRSDEKPPGILTPAQVKVLLETCLNVEPDILPVLILSVFGGVRRAEAEKIEWAENRLPLVLSTGLCNHPTAWAQMRNPRANQKSRRLHLMWLL
jgi:hypothetical protein